MRSLRKKLVVPVAIVCGLVLAPALVGCSNPLESIVEGVTDGNVDLGGTSIPADFPSEVPLASGDVINAFAVGKGADKVFTVIIKVADAAAADEIRAQFEDAGFTTEFDQAAGTAAGASYTNANYGVLVGVTEDGSNGWAATYVVTPAGA